MCWHELRVGDFVLVKNRTTVPADVVALSVVDGMGAGADAGGDAAAAAAVAGVCYVDTKSLDGETNLKMRQALACTAATVRTTADIAMLRGGVEMEHPNNVIDAFTGAATVRGEAVPILPRNVLLRGTVLRNTPAVVGLVVNTGHDTKVLP